MRKLLILLILVLSIVEVSANSGPSVRFGDKNTPLVAMEDTEVEILHEDLVYNIYHSRGYEFYADVVVEYDLFNNSDFTENITALFPRILYDHAYLNIEVFLDRAEIPNTFLVVGGDYENFKSLIKMVNFQMDNPDNEPHIGNSFVGVNMFDLEIPSGSSTLRIEYRETAFGSVNRFLYSDLTYEGYLEYIFEPAKHWKDFGTIDITLNMFMEGFKFTNLPDEFEKDHSKEHVSYKVAYNELPKENLRIEFKEKSIVLPITLVVMALGLYVLVFTSKSRDDLKRKVFTILRKTVFASTIIARILTVAGFTMLIPMIFDENLIVFIFMIIHLSGYVLTFVLNNYNKVNKNIFHYWDKSAVIIGYLIAAILILIAIG